MNYLRDFAIWCVGAVLFWAFMMPDAAGTHYAKAVKAYNVEMMK